VREDEKMSPNADGKTFRVGLSSLPRMLTTTEVAKALGVDPSTLSRWRSQGVGPKVYWLGKASPRYLETDVLEWLERSRS
jgi:predicted DNA-binding transcriptional regulator AlpA